MAQPIKGLWIAVLLLAAQIWLVPDAIAQGGRSGAEIWAVTCRRCHNMRDPQELRDDQWRVSMAHMRVRAGLTGEDTRRVLRFLQASNQPTPARAAARAGQASGGGGELRIAQASPADPERGGAIYRQTCVACHGADGRGALPGVADFGGPGGPLEKSDEALAESIRDGYQAPGSALAMPAKGGNPALTGDDIRAVIAYLRATFGARRTSN